MVTKLPVCIDDVTGINGRWAGQFPVHIHVVVHEPAFKKVNKTRIKQVLNTEGQRKGASGLQYLAAIGSQCEDMNSGAMCPFTDQK